jgi:hypothetical protein
VSLLSGEDGTPGGPNAHRARAAVTDRRPPYGFGLTRKENYFGCDF